MLPLAKVHYLSRSVSQGQSNQNSLPWPKSSNYEVGSSLYVCGILLMVLSESESTLLSVGGDCLLLL